MQLNRKIWTTFLIALMTHTLAAAGAFAAPVADREVKAAGAGGPVALSMYPADNDPSVPANAKLQITFDETVQRTSGVGTIEIRKVNGNDLAASYNVATNTTNISINPSNVVTITPNAGTLQAGVSYYVLISSGAFTSANGSFAGISSATAWNFDVISTDTTNPSLVTMFPTGVGNMPGTGTLTMTFNERVMASSGSIRIVRADTGDTQVISVLSPAVSGSGTVNGSGQSVISIQPPTRLVSNTSYYVLIDSGAFVDVVGNPFAGISSSGSWTFTTSPPLVAAPALTPADNSTGVDGDTVQTLRLDFAVPMKKGPAGKLIQIKNMANNNVVYSINVSSSQVQVAGNRVTVQLSGLLPKNGNYYVLIEPGTFLDQSDNPYEGIVDAATWNFSTEPGVDTTKPTVVSLTPADNGVLASLQSNLTIKFSEPVIPVSGSVVILNTTGGQRTVFCSIPVTSTDILGGGTDTITIKPCGKFVQNNTYAVQISSLAFSDLAGNYYNGISSADVTTWNFSATQDAVPPDLTSTVPAPLANYVRTDATLSATFSEEVFVLPGATGSAIPQGAGTTITLTITADPSDAKKIILTPSANFAAATKYVIRIPNDVILDGSGNYFPGILNDYRWTFQTLGSDTTPPALTGASMDGATLVLTYNEPLDPAPGVRPFPANYYVTVNDVPRQVTAVAVDGSTVRLTLQSGVAIGQIVKVSYTIGSQPLQDLSGNPAPAFSARDVANTSDTTLPKPSSGVVTGNTLTLTFNKTLATVTNTAISQFTVRVNGSVIGISSLANNGTNLVFTLSGSVGNSQSVSVTYTAGSAPIRDLSGNAATSFANFYVQNTNDATPPAITGATISGTKLVLTFNEGLQSTSVPLKSSFSVLAGATTVVVSSVAVVNNTVELTLAQAVPANQTVTVYYIPGSPGILDLAGNPAAAISGYTASAAGTTKVNSAYVNGSTLVLNYSGTLSSSSVPLQSQYSVRVNGTSVGVTSVVVSGSQVTLTLASAVSAGVPVTISYNLNGYPLKDAQGVNVETFSELTVTNNGSSGANVPDYMEYDGTNALKFRSSAYTMSVGQTPSGRSANKYSIEGDKLVGAFTALRTAGTSVAQVTLEVPTTENGAIVSLPVVSLLDATTKVSNGAFRLKYGDYDFVLPLSAINYYQLQYTTGLSTSSAQLVLKIERTTSAPLSSAISSNGARLIGSPVNFAAYYASGTTEHEIADFDQYVERTIAVPASGLTAENLSVVRLDPVTGEAIYTPTTTVNAGSQILVRFKRKGNSVYAVSYKAPTVYSDMTKHWARNEVALLASKYIVTGPTSGKFDPQRNVTRAEFAEFIARGLGLSGDRSAAARFSDVGVTGPSSAFIGAASKAGIVEGGTDGRFRPNASITREEMATMMMRAMNYAGVQASISSSALSKFSDRSQISSWAMDAVAANVNAGIIQGVTSTTFKPKDNATRAQAALMIKRFLDFVNFLP